MSSERSNDCIWVKGINTICGHHKKALLDYIDALRGKYKDNNEIGEALGFVKAKVHNDLSQVQLSIGILFSSLQAGGTIEPFGDSFDRGQDRQHYKKQFDSRPKDVTNKS